MPTARPIAIVLVAAVADNGVIGNAGALPWRLKSDLDHFRALTLGHPLVMGRKTYQSIGRPLPGRTTIVVSREPGFAAPGVVVAPTLAAALEVARGDALRRGVAAVMGIGGADLYTQMMPLASRLEITRVHARPVGDVRFPPVDAQEWRETGQRAGTAGAQDEAPFTFVSYQRLTASPPAHASPGTAPLR